MTGEYTFVAPERQNELTRRIQQRLATAAAKSEAEDPVPAAPTSAEVPPGLAHLRPVTPTLQ